MTDSLIQFSKFAAAFNKNNETETASQRDIQLVEESFKIKLPEDYRLFLRNYGNLWTPHILDIVADNEIELNDIQQFLTPDEIIDDKENGVSNQITENLIPFATDCMGNIFAFKAADLQIQVPFANVYFFDLDFDNMDLVADSFTELIEEFNSLILFL